MGTNDETAKVEFKTVRWAAAMAALPLRLVFRAY